MLNKKTVDDLKDLKGKKVLVRCDFNVPLKDGVIQNFNRIGRRAADHQEAPRSGRKGDSLLPSRQAEGRAAAGDEPFPRSHRHFPSASVSRSSLSRIRS